MSSPQQVYVVTAAHRHSPTCAYCLYLCSVSQVSWFAVGCYYLSSGRHELARRYLNKATSLNRVFGPAWLAYGHSFAAENEHDQAMAAYFTASQLMKGLIIDVLLQLFLSLLLKYALTI